MMKQLSDHAAQIGSSCLKEMIVPDTTYQQLCHRTATAIITLADRDNGPFLNELDSPALVAERFLEDLHRIQSLVPVWTAISVRSDPDWAESLSLTVVDRVGPGQLSFREISVEEFFS